MARVALVKSCGLFRAWRQVGKTLPDDNIESASRARRGCDIVAAQVVEQVGMLSASRTTASPAGRRRRPARRCGAIGSRRAGRRLAGNRPVKPLRQLGQDRAVSRRARCYGLIGRSCPHRGTDLA
jgi:hypothetical protein